MPRNMMPKDYLPPRNLETYNREYNLPRKNIISLDTSSIVSSDTIDSETYNISDGRKRPAICSPKVKLLKETLDRDKPFSKPPRKKPAKLSPVPRLAEIDEVWNSFPNLGSHKRPDTKTYRNAVKWIRIIERGTLYKHVNKPALIKAMVKFAGVKASTLNNLLQKKFNAEERRTVYAALNELRNSPRRRKSIPGDLATLVYNPYSHLSQFLLAYLSPLQEITDDDPVVTICAELIMEFCMGRPDKYKCFVVARELKDYWDAVIEHSVSWEAKTHVFYVNGFIIAFCEFLEEHYDRYRTDIHPGWFKIDSVPMRKFLVEFYSTYGNIRGEYDRNFYRRLFKI